METAATTDLTPDHPTPVATFHLLRERPGRAIVALARLGLDRRRLASTDGLLFWRLLGTGRASNTGPSIDARRTAVFAVWRNAASAERFEASMASRWVHLAESYHLRMVAIGGHGSWNGFDVIGAVRAGGPTDSRSSTTGPVVVITRAEVRVRHLRQFTVAARQVNRQLRDTPGLLAVCGVGEAPIARQATLSIWQSAAHIEAFGARPGHHRETVARTRRDGWYGEELFARFRPIGARGTWNGDNPLAGLIESPEGETS